MLLEHTIAQLEEKVSTCAASDQLNEALKAFSKNLEMMKLIANFSVHCIILERR